MMFSFQEEYLIFSIYTTKMIWRLALKPLTLVSQPGKKGEGRQRGEERRFVGGGRNESKSNRKKCHQNGVMEVTQESCFINIILF